MIVKRFENPRLNYPDSLSSQFTSNDPVDMWTPLHFVAGTAIGVIGIRPDIAAPLIIGFEILENQMLGGVGGGESVANSATDVLVGIMGYVFGLWLAQRLNPQLAKQPMYIRRIRPVR